MQDFRQDSGHSNFYHAQQFFLFKICGEPFSPNLSSFVWRHHVGAHADEHQHGGRKLTETTVTEFCYKSVNFSLEELKNIKIVVFPIHELFK